MKALMIALGLLAFGSSFASAQYVPLERRDWERRQEQQRADEDRERELRRELQRIEARIAEYRQEEARREEWRREHEREEERERRVGDFGRWDRNDHPYEERMHDFCQQRARQVFQLERDVAAGRSDHREREILIGLKTELDSRCNAYRWHG